MRIYTRTGDQGMTGLAGTTRRVSKDDPRIQALGALDELNASLGVALAHAGPDEDLARWIGRIQRDVFVLGAEVAASPGPERGEAGGAEGEHPRITHENVASLERMIDGMESDLPPLHHFILPGGTSTGAMLHLSRTICRRAERSLVALARAEGVRSTLLAYVNRLADALFVLARWANARAGATEVPWIGSPPPTGET